MSAPPRETPEAGQKLYGPIAQRIGELIGQEVVYQHPKAWLSYSFEMRKGAYDIVFDGPHFGAWRITHIQHEPLVKLPGQLVFQVYTAAENEEIQTLDDLSGRLVCGLSSPNLATMTMLFQNQNPARQPTVVDIRQGGFKAVFKAHQDGKCRGAVAPKRFIDKGLSDEERASIKVLFTSKGVPNQTLTVGPRITRQQQAIIIREFTTPEGAASASALFQRFSRNATAFQPAVKADYDGLNLLLEGLVWGW
jgi:hypothetical protein